MTDEIKKLKEWIDGSDNIVFFGGAGVSTESNIPDFRSVDGLYNQEYDYPPETILSHSFYMSNPEEDRLMATQAYQAKIVRGIANGVDSFFAS